MSKRQYSDFGEHERRPGEDDTSSKRPRPSTMAPQTNALVELSENADDLIECLQSLKRWSGAEGNPPQGDDKNSFPEAAQLSVLSRKILPSLQTIANSDAGPINHHEPPTKVAQPRATVDTLPVPAVAVGPWKASEIPQQLPPLPVVKNRDIETEAFRHPGMTGGPHYERLEWLGDAYLELIATIIISRTFPDMPSGRCSQLREQLVRNTTLSDYFRRYNMTQKALLPPEIFRPGHPGRGRSSDKDLIKTQGDMFEAYVAAIITSDPENGLTDCVNWLKSLWSTTIKDQIIKAEEERPRVAVSTSKPAWAKEVTPKENLAKLIVVKGIKIEYKDKPSKEKKDRNLSIPLFTVGVYLTGWGEQDKLLGWGSAINKKEAGQKAAEMAMENKKIIKVYQQKKAAYMEAQAARLAAQGLDKDGNELGPC